MLERILIAGSGGQGIILAGKLLAAVAIDTSPHVTFFPAYGAEVRGGTSNCQVILSADEIASPVPEVFDSMLIMNEASADLFLAQAGPACFTLFNGAPGSQPRANVCIDATGLANQLGDTRVANFVMLGAYLVRKPVVNPSAFESHIAQALQSKPQPLIDLNIKAFQTGLATA